MTQIIGYVVIDDTDGDGGCIIEVHEIEPQKKGYTDYNGVRYGTTTTISHRHFEKLPVYVTLAEAQVACAKWVRADED